jgi:hypothetical protein
MSNRAKRVLVYTAALLLAPLPVMPFEAGTREFAYSLVPCSIILSLGSLYVARGELRTKARDMLGMKLIGASVVTLLFGVAMFAGTLIYLLR